MLPPVLAVSNTSVVPEKPTVPLAEELTSLALIPDASIALSRAASAGVEGKLNMLLIAARNRMIESLLAVIDAVSQSLDMPREADESNTAHALRLAQVVANLAPRQLAALQQQIDARGQPVPLRLVAQALQDPSGPAAARIIAQLEVAPYRERDLVTRAIVSTYGENNGEAEPPETATAQAPRAAQQAQAVKIDIQPETAARAEQVRQPGTPATVTTTTPPPGSAEPAEVIQPKAAIQVPLASAAMTEIVADAAEVEIATVLALADDADPQVAAAAATDEPLQAQAPVPVRPQPASVPVAVPTELRQIADDVKEGLQVVVRLAIGAAGPELVSIMAEGERAADAVIAQALIADVLDSAELRQSVVVSDADGSELAMVLTSPALISAEDVTGEPLRLATPAVAAGSTSETTTPSAPNLPAPDAQMKAPAPLPLGVPFAIAQYLPAETVTTNPQATAVTRVEAVDDEEPGGRRDDRGEENAEDEAASEEHSTGDDAAESQARLAAEENDVTAFEEKRGEATLQLAALPAPAPPIRMPDTAYDLYQRMAGWE